MKDLLYKVALTKIPLVGAVTARNLVSYCGGVEEVFRTRKSDLMKIPGVGGQTALNVSQHSALKEAESELRFIEEHSISPLFYLDKDYPKRLRPFNDSPVMLYYKGVANLDHFRTVGIIGTRTPTPQGQALCEELVQEFAPYKPLIISGLAYGVDITAHRKSLDMGLETVGILGHGLSRIYPQQHRKTAIEMMEQGGLLTEFPSQVGPEKDNFPMRNRIVAALSDVLVVVETAIKGGSMITAQQANDYNKDVFALPGRVKDKFSQGCNFLIKSNLAALAENADDIAKTMRWDIETSKKAGRAIQGEFFQELNEREKQIIDLIQKQDEIGVDQLSYQMKIPNSELASLLLDMEFRGIVRALPGKRYMLS